MNSTAAREALEFDQVYQRLHALAHRQRGQMRAGETLNTTALVHEAYLHLCEPGREIAPRDFFAYAARAMRNILIDDARRSLRAKHGGDLRRVDLEDAQDLQTDARQLIDLDQALKRLAQEDSRAAQVVEMHYFGGIELTRIAEVLGVSERTVNRDWRAARAWLQRELAG